MGARLVPGRSHWVDETTLEVRLRKGLRYQDGEEFSAESFRRAFEEVQRVMLEANRDHWNTERGPRLERVVFRNDLSPAEALELVCSGERDVDIVSEVSPADARRVEASEHAKLVRVDAMRVLTAIINRDAEGAPLLAAQHALVERVLPLPFDVLVFAWLDLSSDAPPAFMHRQFFHSTGAFRAGPPIPRFDDLLARFATATDPDTLAALTTDLDRLAYDQALGVFLCAPRPCTRSTGTSASTAAQRPSSWPRRRSPPAHWSRR